MLVWKMNEMKYTRSSNSDSSRTTNGIFFVVLLIKLFPRDMELLMFLCLSHKSLLVLFPTELTQQWDDNKRDVL